jgi:hypothetical protein
MKRTISNVINQEDYESDILYSKKVVSCLDVNLNFDRVRLINFQDNHINKFVAIQKYWRAYKARRTVKLFKKLPIDIKLIIFNKVRQGHYYKRYKNTICRIVSSKFTFDLQDYIFRDYSFYSLIYVDHRTVRDFADKLLYILYLYTKYIITLSKVQLLKIIKFDIKLYYFCSEASVILDNPMYINEFNIRFKKFIKTYKLYHKLHYEYPQSMFFKVGRVINNINGLESTNNVDIF